VPQKIATTGQRGFCSSQTAVIQYSIDGTTNCTLTLQ
jgi:hypothetical protein